MRQAFSNMHYRNWTSIFRQTFSMRRCEIDIISLTQVRAKRCLVMFVVFPFDLLMDAHLLEKVIERTASQKFSLAFIVNVSLILFPTIDDLWTCLFDVCIACTSELPKSRTHRLSRPNVDHKNHRKLCSFRSCNHLCQQMFVKSTNEIRNKCSDLLNPSVVC